MNNITTGIRSIIWRVAPVILFFALWESAARFGSFSAVDIFPPFSAVLLEIIRLFDSGIMFRNITDTLIRVVLGLCIGVSGGVIIGIVMGWRHLIGRALSPIISILYPIPALGWIPLMMLWIGINEMLPVAVITISSFFPVCYNTVTGIRNVDPAMIKAAHILGASEMRILFRVILPNAVPQVFSGLRLSSGMAWRTVLAAEMVAIPTGIGSLIMNAESLVRVDIILSCLFILSLFCLVFEKILNLLEKKWLGKWSHFA